MKRTAIILMLITIMSKVIGFGREIALSYYYGASNISDAFLISQTIPMVIFAFIGTGIVTSYIPMYINITKNYGEEKGIEYTSNLINALFLISSIIMVFGMLFTDDIVKVFASGFKGETLALAIKLTKISIWGIYFNIIVYMLSGFLNMKGNFSIPALIGFPMNFIAIFSIALSYHFNVLLLSIGSVLASVSQILFLIPYVRKKGYKYKFFWDYKNEHLMKMTKIVPFSWNWRIGTGHKSLCSNLHDTTFLKPS